MVPIIIVHGGVSQPLSCQDGVDKAATAARKVIEEENKTALEAAIAAVVVMENDGRFDAGTGSYYNLDGGIEMDAAVMDEKERCGAVAAIKNVKNPILIANELIDTPHILLAGEGALKFARAKGYKKFEPGTEKTKKRLEDIKERLERGDVHEWAAAWKNYQRPGTVGAVVFDGKNGFGAANSTGGTSYQLPGRVGDSAIIGCGLYASASGAVCTTGIGEDIIRKILAKGVYDKIESGMSPQEACEWGVKLYPKSVPMGVTAVTSDDHGIYANDIMPSKLLIF
jgi:L-asparaginase/beta-aspartyl-peptidase (threonine type)